MRLTLLGTGCPEPSLRRASSGYMIEVSGERLLFDVGGGVFDRLLQAGVMPTEIDRLFLSHLHSDHMMDYARLVHAQWDAGKGLLGTPPMAVYGPHRWRRCTSGCLARKGRWPLTSKPDADPGSQEVWSTALAAASEPQVRSRRLRRVARGRSLASDHLRRAHADPFLTGLAFRLDADGKSIVYSVTPGCARPLRHWRRMRMCWSTGAIG